MASGIFRASLMVGLALGAMQIGRAEDRRFDDLLARAEVQAAEGHRYEPPGDNVTETVADMMDLIASATPDQLVRLSALLEDPRLSPDTKPSGDARTAIAPAGPEQYRTPPAGVAPLPDRTDIPHVAPRPVGVLGGRDSATAVPMSTRPGSIQPGPIQRGPETASQMSPPPGPRAKELLARGQAAERQGDVSGARRFYASAAREGEAMAARSLGRLYDPAYLKQTALGGIDPDPELARHWYEQAVLLGDLEAGSMLKSLAAR